MTGQIEGKTAIVTGAGRGMGAAIAALFAAEGANVIATDLDPPAFDSMTCLAQDVRDERRWDEIVALAQSRFGAIDILVNNAGILAFEALLDTSADRFRALLDVNLLGAFFGLRAAGAAMTAQGRGAIVNICSIDATKATNGVGAYAASKWGLRGLSKVAAMELGPRGVRVNMIHPGGINTPMVNPAGMPDDQFDQIYGDIPLGRSGTARDVAEAALFLASDRAAYLTGAEIVVDGGVTVGKYYPDLPGSYPPDR